MERAISWHIPFDEIKCVPRVGETMMLPPNSRPHEVLSAEHYFLQQGPPMTLHGEWPSGLSLREAHPSRNEGSKSVSQEPLRRNTELDSLGPVREGQDSLKERAIKYGGSLTREARWQGSRGGMSSNELCARR